MAPLDFLHCAASCREVPAAFGVRLCRKCGSMTTQPPVPADVFIGSVEGFDSVPAAVQTDLLVLYLLRHGGASDVTASTIASLREALHLAPQPRLAQYLSEQTKKRGPKPGKYVKTKSGYVLERGYAKTLETQYAGRPSAKNLSASLRGTLSAAGDPAVRAYLEECIGCFEHNLLRSSIIMAWCVAYGSVRAWLFRNHLAALNAAMAAWKTPFQVAKLDDFQELTEAVIIDTARKSGILTKEQHKTLKQLLDQRNSYAHPTMKMVSPSVAEAYIETVLKEVLSTYG